LMKPEIRPNSVVLPAPFGPINPVMRPASAAIVTPLTASSPPNRRVTPSPARSGSASRRLPPAKREAPALPAEEADQAARREGDDQHEHAAIDDEVQPRRVAREIGRRLTERLAHQRADPRPE